PKGLEMGLPIHLVHVSAGSASASESRPAYFPRNIVVAGGSSRVDVIESFIGFEDQSYLVNSAIDIVVGANAQVNHVRIQHESAEGYHVGIVRADLARDSRLSTFTFTAGGALVRNNLH